MTLSLANDEVGDARRCVWRRTGDGEGYAFARLARDGGGWRADGTEILVVRGRPIRTDMTVFLDHEWRTRRVRVECQASTNRTRVLDVDDSRRWRVNGRRASRLDGCIDVDVAATPLTNTFPIRRYADLAVAGTRTSPTAWIEVPSLRVIRVDQTYTRLGHADGEAVETWEYGDPLHGTFRLTVDAFGLVVDYESFAVRVAVR